MLMGQMHHSSKLPLLDEETTGQLNLLQGLVHAETGICTEPDLYVRQRGACAVSRESGHVVFGPGGVAEFDTLFNLFSLGKWQHHCGLTDIRLVLIGEGTFELRVTQAIADSSHERVYNELITFQPDEPFELDISGIPSIANGGVLFFELRSLGIGRLKSANWMTAQAPVRTPEIAVVITTFRREEAVRKAVDRFRHYLASSSIGEHVHVIVVDNGKSAGIEADQYVSPMDNENLGGSGGFARGLIEARRRGATHTLFMDDEAKIHMSSIERTWTFLAYAKDERTAIAGALARATDKWALWENGATFLAKCNRLFGDVDMRNFHHLLSMEAESIGVPWNFYGGWWYFAFPTACVEHPPFPFFVRGDDVSFSLANGFRMTTLPGVITFQDADFTDKITPLTEYLDLRSHMVHHLSLPSMDIGALRTVKIAAWFFARAMCYCRYETLEALNLAIEDVMEGPDFFARNADIARRRADIKALTKAEGYSQHDGAMPPRTPDADDAGRWTVLLMKFTLNGHLLPFFRAFATRKVLLAGEQAMLCRIWGAKHAIYLNRVENTSISVSHSKSRAFRQSRRMVRNGLRFIRCYGRLRQDWQAGYRRIATDDYWERTLKLGERPSP
ncbi:glycosyltransferase [Tropicimonas isoalkanivorans]|uniref:Glycosyltransferase, GT2 family n=1 Tax=Tropicimonas isoalkanivorans TaxID=441112 RepID=A0A1I1LU77_9RHOB|nr:glycosyltransferase [Tropicimonas isoalkanivorans]SFC73020.1 Glycosyltransferase, GT2 family [Tropicimonas isoalkanivorans]